VTHHLRVGQRQWTTRAEGTVVREGFRPVGGMEMGGKSSYCQQPTVTIRHDDGELTEVAIDEATVIEPVGTV
jgi:hypothetical protein